MIPLKDENPSGCFPWVTYLLIVVNITIFFWELSIPRNTLQSMMQNHYGMVPAHVTEALQGKRDILTGVFVPMFTSMFMHGGWMHLIGNMLFLFVFGDNVEARLRHGPFLAFYLFCGIAASVMHYMLSAADSMTPTIGASGAIAGVLGAYIVCWPAARIVTLIPIFYFIRIVTMPAFVVLGLWFGLQFLRGLGSMQAGTDGGGVAYWAHVGGFIAGLTLMMLFQWRRKMLKK